MCEVKLMYSTNVHHIIHRFEELPLAFKHYCNTSSTAFGKGRQGEM